MTFKNIVAELRPISILLTSGTLSPIESYETELQIPFAVKQACGHVIDADKQVFVRVVKHSLNRQKFDFSYRERSKDTMLLDLGNSLINLLRVVPAGALVFFSSYAVLTAAVKLWKEKPFEDELTFFAKLDAVKTVCVEVAPLHPEP